MRYIICLLASILLLGVLGPSSHATTAFDAGASPVALWQLPGGAIQPQAVVDSKGTVHVIYFKAGRSEGVGNLYYIHRAPGDTTASAPIRVNSLEDSAGSVGTVRTAHVAVGQHDRMHVVWNGLGKKGTNGFQEGYQAYARLNESGTAFEPQRNLIVWATGLDGGGSVAADRVGNIYVVWHAMANAKDETGRAVFVAHSTDNGQTFSKEKQANPEPTGACGCCGLRAFADSKGVLYILYRAATNGINRDTTLLVSRDRGQTFAEKRLHRWSINACPMSTYALAESTGGVVAAWETTGRVYSATIDPTDLSVTSPTPVPGTDQKNPFVVAAANGQTLLIWTEGTGWQRGGSLAWQLLDKNGAPVSSGARAGAIPVWGLATAYAEPNGKFVIIY